MGERFNDIAREFLERCGFNCEPEPTWVAGRKPDFFCTGPFDLWVEVKSLGEPQRYKDLFQIFDYLRNNQHKVTGTGYAMAHTAPTATTKDARVALGLANYALSRPEAKAHTSVWIIIPDEPNYDGAVSFTIKTEKVPVWLVSAKSATGRYGYPFYLEPDPWRQKIDVSDDLGVLAQYDLDQFANEECYRFALAIHPDEQPFRLLSTGLSGGAQRSTTRERIRHLIGDAANQLKSGLKHREAAACVFMYQESALAPEDIEILSALLGDLAYRFQPSDFQSGEMGFAGNAAWQRKKNTTVSAITYFRNNDLPVTVHNPHAARPLQPGVFGGREWFIDPDESQIQCRLVDHTEPSS